MSKYQGLREEEIKNKVAVDFFCNFDHTQIIGNIDFCIAPKDKVDGARDLFDDTKYPPLLWAEAKKGIVKDINESFVQLILTIGKARVFDTTIPPNFLGAFDCEKIAFIPWHLIQDVFTQNDFNWNVTPSNHGTKEFLQLYELVKDILNKQTLLFNFTEQEKELKSFIKSNFKTGINTLAKIKVNKNNFTFVYQRWCKSVMPTISVDWIIAKRAGLIDADFFLADLLSKENKTLKEKLFVLLQDNRYILDRKIDDTGFETSKQATFKDNQKAHNLFWNLYERPPKKEYWNYIIERRDLLVPQDVRERKGSFFTPQQWVELSQKYLADVLGENWQDEYYIWDCCAGTGNLLNGLTNKRNIFASTLDKSDVDIMKDRIQNGWGMFENHVFQFDFLNDDFIPICEGGKIPDNLYQIISNEEKRKKLVVYINPPYAEGDSRIGKGRSGVAISKTQERYSTEMGYAKREIFIQFMTRINKEMHNCKLAQFSKLKALSAPNFSQIRKTFQAKLKSLFFVPADTFDNVKGQFPIGFHIWDTNKIETFTKINADVFDKDANFIQKKLIINNDGNKFINDWVDTFTESDKSWEKINSIANIIGVGNDFQHQSTVVIETPNKPWNHQFQWQITLRNITQSCIYLAVRHCIKATWINDRDQFLYPNDNWKEDKEFQADCLIYTLFHGQNRITSTQGTNHWIPFTEEQVGITYSFESHFMSDFINGKATLLTGELQFEPQKQTDKIVLSTQAQAVYNTGLKLWQYYHTKQDANINASFYDIREYFQGRNSQGKMNIDSNDEYYTEIIKELRNHMKTLAQKIETKVYEYEFLK